MGLFRLLARTTIGLRTGWALAALAAGAAGSAAVLAAAEQEVEKEVEQSTADRESAIAAS
jgi:hypothetical protein